MELVIHSERIAISTESFPPMKQELLMLQIDERVRPVGPWAEDTILHHCTYLLDKDSSLNSFVIISLPETDIRNVLSSLTGTGLRINRCVTHVAAVAALAGQLTDEPIISCILDKSYLEILVTEKGIPYYSQISPIDDQLVDFDIIAQAVFNVRQIIDSRFNKSVKKTLIFSKEKLDIPDKLGEEKIWRPDFDFVSGGNHDIVWRFPQLIGALFVPKSFDCLPEDLRFSYLIQDINKVAVFVALSGVAILGASGLYLSNQHVKVLADFQQLDSSVENRKTELIKKMPGRDEASSVAHVLKVINSVSKEPPLDALLYSLALSVPEDVIIDEIKIDRKPDQNMQSPAEAPSPEMLSQESASQLEGHEADKAFFDMPLTVWLRFLTSGDFQQVKTRLEKTVDLLGAKFEVSNIKMEYKEDTGQGQLSCRLEILGEGV